MAEPSLLCVSCARPPPPHRRTWGRCTVCVERDLPSTYYCGEECMNAHWQNGHKEYHKAQKQMAKDIREGTVSEYDRSIAETVARRAEATGDEYAKRFAAALALVAEGDHNAAAKAWRKIIKDRPDKPDAHFNLALVLQRSSRFTEAAPMCLKAMELYPDGTKDWAVATAAAFNLLRLPDCEEMPKPEWWNDEGLKALSARVVTVAPDLTQSCAMRARVLSGSTLFKPLWKEGPRTAAEIKEAATWYRRAAMVKNTSAEKLHFEQYAGRCDEVADPLLAEEEAEAAKARAAAEAEAAKARAAAEAEAAKARAAAAAEEAEALKVAEAKAAAAAEELLAEEENEKQAEASTKASKARQSKGEKGKGKR